MTEPRKRIFVADDHPMLREGVVKVINLQPDMCVCGEGGTAAEVLQAVETRPIDAMLLDLTLGNADGLSLLKQLKTLRPELPVLMFSMHNEETFAQRALEAGADGYLMKQEPPARVIASLRSVMQGEIALSPRMNTRLLKAALANPDRPESDSVARQLTDRELHVFQQIGAGVSPTQIARSISLSVKTVESHIAKIKIKLNLRDSAELKEAAMKWIEGQ